MSLARTIRFITENYLETRSENWNYTTETAGTDKVTPVGQQKLKTLGHLLNHRALKDLNSAHDFDAWLDFYLEASKSLQQAEKDKGYFVNSHPMLNQVLKFYISYIYDNLIKMDEVKFQNYIHAQKDKLIEDEKNYLYSKQHADDKLTAHKANFKTQQKIIEALDIGKDRAFYLNFYKEKLQPELEIEFSDLENKVDVKTPLVDAAEAHYIPGVAEAAEVTVAAEKPQQVETVTEKPAANNTLGNHMHTLYSRVKPVKTASEANAEDGAKPTTKTMNGLG